MYNVPVPACVDTPRHFAPRIRGLMLLSLFVRLAASSLAPTGSNRGPRSAYRMREFSRCPGDAVRRACFFLDNSHAERLWKKENPNGFFAICERCFRIFGVTCFSHPVILHVGLVTAAERRQRRSRGVRMRGYFGPASRHQKTIPPIAVAAIAAIRTAPAATSFARPISG